MKFVLYSTPESAECGTPSLIGVVETILAMGVCAWVVARKGTTSLTIAACIAPLLMLQTPEAAELALLWYLKQKEHRNFRFLSLCTVASLLWAYIVLRIVDHRLILAMHPTIRLVMAISALPALIGAMTTLPFNVGSILFVVFRYPIMTTIRHIPSRWWRIAFCVDFVHPPELIPGTSLQGKRREIDPLLTPHSIIKETLRSISPEWNEANPLVGPVLLIPIVITTVIGLALPAWLYRWSLKGTSLLWFPLVWTIHKFSKEDSRTLLEGLK